MEPIFPRLLTVCFKSIIECFHQEGSLALQEKPKPEPSTNPMIELALVGDISPLDIVRRWHLVPPTASLQYAPLT